MSLIVFLHILFVGIWGGCVAVELIIEFLGTKEPALGPTVALFHYNIDRFVEIPVVTGVLVTGVLQIQSMPSLDTAHLIKIGAGLTAVLANYLCIIPVVRRFAKTRAHEPCTNQIFWAAKIGGPAGAVALALGLHFLGIF